MLKEKLIEASKTIDVDKNIVAGLFESTNINSDTKTQLAEAFEIAVRNTAVKLAEEHINAVASKADELVEEEVIERTQAVEAKLVESIDSYLDHIGDTWLQENRVDIVNSIKVSLFDSLLESMKDVFVEHNVNVPTESVDVVAELEEEAQEQKDEAQRLFTQLREAQQEIGDMKRSILISKHTNGLTESQTERVTSLLENVSYSDSFESKVTAIVSMVGEAQSQSITENEDKKPLDPTALNYTVTQVNEDANAIDDSMADYMNAI